MSMKHSVLLAFAAFLFFMAAGADTGSGEISTPEASAATNLYLVSDTVTGKAWTRQTVMATPSNTVMDLSGVFVGAAEAAVHSNEAERIVAVSQAAIEGVRGSFKSLYAVTQNVAKTAYHVAMVIPPAEGGASLQGFVVKEETDGMTDTQWVWYSHDLPVPPVRYVEYVTPQGRFSQNVKWDSWSAAGENLTVNGRTWKGCHRCTLVRPQSVRGLPVLTRQNEYFGGEHGFDFGAALVTVGGRPTRTGVVTNDVTGEIWRFDNGALKTDTKEADE